MANEAVCKYLFDTNRPYSCENVTVNLRGAFSKGAVQKALDALCENGKIKCKLYGKQKVYAAVQPETDPGDEEVEDYDAQLKNLTQELAEKTTSLKTSESKLKTITSTPTTESAMALIDGIKRSVATIESKLEVLRDSTEVLSAEEKKEMMGAHDTYLREYRKRKRTCNDMIEPVLEGYPKSKRDFLDELCIETDEEVGFKLMSN